MQVKLQEFFRIEQKKTPIIGVFSTVKINAGAAQRKLNYWTTFQSKSAVQSSRE